MALHIPWFCLFVLFQVVHGNEEYKREGIIDHLSNGMKFAKDFLDKLIPEEGFHHAMTKGSWAFAAQLPFATRICTQGSESVAMKVAEFVVKAFQPTNTPTPNRRHPYNDAYADASSEETFAHKRPDHDINEEPSPMSPLRHLVRLFGLQPNQISAVAVNALVFVAQMISTFLSGPKRPGRPYRSDDPTSWILNKNSRRLQDLIETAKNETLSDDIEDLIQQQGSEETSCIRLLVCKITPFVNRMQRAVFGKDNQTSSSDEEIRGSAVLYRHLPTAEEINDRNDICEQKHRDCDLNEY